MAAITFDTYTDAGEGTSKDRTLSHTVSAGTNPLLVVMTWGRSGVSASRGVVTACTYNGVSLDRATSRTWSSAGGTAEIWYMANPPTGSSYTVSVTFTNTLTSGTVVAASFHGVDQADPIGDVNGADNTNDSTPTVGVTPSTISNWAVVVFGAAQTSSAATDGSFTSIINYNMTNTHVSMGRAGPIADTSAQTYGLSGANSTDETTAIVALLRPGYSGTGAVGTSVSAVAGAGKQTFKGTGAVGTAVSVLSGEGSVAGGSTFTGTGAVGTAVSLLSGAGKQAFTGTGAVGTAVSLLSGAGKQAFTGTGAVGTAVSLLSGAGKQTFTGTGAVGTAVSLLAGTGTVASSAVTGTGSVGNAASVLGFGVSWFVPGRKDPGWWDIPFGRKPERRKKIIVRT